MIKSKCAVLLLFVVIVSFCYGGDISVSARVNSQKIGINDQLQLTLSISGTSGSLNSPDLGVIKDFNIVGSSSSSRISIVNGKMTSSKELVYTLLPLKKGKLKIPSIKLWYKEQLYATKEIAIEVVDGSIATSRRRNSPFSREPVSRSNENTNTGNAVFLRAETKNKSIYMGEPVYLEYNIYTQYAISGGEVSEMPDFKDFIAEDIEIKEDEPQKTAVLNNQTYHVIPVARKLLFPAKTGEITIDPMVIALRIRARSSDPFDVFSFMGRDELIYRKTEPLTINVMPLPEKGKPENFSGAVGKFTISAKISAHEIGVNDALTLEVTYLGSGNINSIPVPDLPDLPDFEVHDPEVSQDIDFRDGTMKGKLTWKYILIPKVAGEYKIPPISLTYFDKKSGQYRTTSTGSFPVTVTGTAGQVMISEGKRDVVSLYEDIKYIKPLNKELKDYARNTLSYKLIAMIILVPPAFNIIFFIFTFYLSRRAINTDIIKAKRAANMAIKNIKKASGDNLLVSIGESLNVYASNRLKLPQQGLTSDIIMNKFGELGCSKETIENFLKIMSICEESRYSPTASQFSAKEIREKSKDAIMQLERSIKQK